MFSSAMASTTANPNGANYGLGSRGPLSGSAVPQQGQSNAQRELTDDQRQEIKEAVSRSYSKYIFMLILVQFDVFDTDNDNFLDYHELKVAMRALGFDSKKPEVLQILRDHDRHGRRMISFEDFMQVSK